MSQEEIFINGELLRLRREARGWVLGDLATRACMSVKQIRQLEEGGLSSFYSVAVKITSAKKVGALLGLSAEEVFAKDLEPSDVSETDELEVDSAESEETALEIKSTEVESAVNKGALTEVETTNTKESVASEPVLPSSTLDEPKSKTSLWVIFALFAAALGVAAYMQPKDEPIVEVVPPLQVLPADVADPASAASASDTTASSAEVVALPASASASVITINSQKPASTASAPASAARSASPSASGVAPMVTRPASSSLLTPSANNASK
jgi:cytoskeleton protein RodZ